MAEVLVIGVAVVDFVFALDQLPDRPAKYRALGTEIVGGGCAANAAVAIARLGGKARLGARLGDDPLGDLIVGDLADENVDISLVQRTPGARSSFSSVYVDARGERQIVNFRGEGLSQETTWIGAVRRVDAVLADTRWSAGAQTALELAQNLGIPGVVDAEAPMDAQVLKHASHVAFSRDGLFSFASESRLETALRLASESLPGWACVTDGENGTYWFEDDEIVHAPAFGVEVRDTLGAGDVWHGAFTLALAEGRTEGDAVRFANAAAALKCATFGGRKGCPDRTAVEKYLEENDR